MALDSVLERFTQPQEQEFYKIFRTTKYGSLYNMCHAKTSRRKLNVLYHAKIVPIQTWDNDGYMSGFHAYANKADALDTIKYWDHFAVVRCVGKVHTTGLTDGQCAHKTIVAATMTLLEVIKNE